MTLSKQAMDKINLAFKEMGVPIVVKIIYFFQPEYFKSYYEQYEQIENIHTLFGCNRIRVNIEISIEDRNCGFDLKYRSEDNQLTYQGCTLNHLDFEELEVPEEVLKQCTRSMDVIASVIIPGALNAILTETS